MSQRGKRERLGKQILTVFLTLAMIVSLTPSLGVLTGGALGAQEAYAADGISGSVNASTLTFGGEYTLTDDTTIYIDASNIIRSINVEGYTLTIEGNEEDILSVGSIKGYQGNVVLNSGSLDLDTATGEENWAAAVGLTLGGFTMNGGGLFLNCTGNGRYSSYGINAQSFTMNGGTANVRCVTDTTGSAVGIAVNDFNMTGGDLSVDAVTTIENESAYGIEANGATSDSNFHMSGGTLETTGTADTEGYGINWTGDRDKNNFVVDGGKLTAVGVKNGINSWVPVSISGGADVTARSTKSAALYASQAMISINGVGTKVSANSAKGDAIAAYKSTIELGSGVGIIQPENGYVATYGGDSQAIKDASDNWAKEVVIQEVCPAGGGHDWQIVNHKASFTVDGYQSMECSKCGKEHPDGIAIGALKVKTAELEKTSYVYTGNTIKPAVTLASADGPLSKDYYTVSYTDSKGNAVTAPKNAGTYKVKITLKGDYYEGTKTLTFKITPKKITPAVTLSATAYTYNGKVRKPAVTVKNGSTKLGTSQYTVTYASGRKNVGKYTVKVTMKGNYSGTKTVSFKINPKGTTLTSVVAASKGFTAKWNKQATQTTGYQIYYATSSTAPKAGTTPKVTISKTGTVSKKVTGLKAGKKYYVYVRTYKTVNGVKYYSAWSKAKTVTTKK